jgi:Papain family cysteine protease
MKPIRHFFTVSLLLLILVLPAISQDTAGVIVRKMGLIRSEDYSAIPQTPVYYGLGFSRDIPDRVSLKAYCPPVQDQQDVGSCVGWASGYAAYSMSVAIQNRQAGNMTVPAPFSALYIYNNIKSPGDDPCGGGGSQFEDALVFLKNRGDCMSRQYDFPANVCNKYVSADVLSFARSHTIKDYERLFADDMWGQVQASIKVEKTIQMLANNKPVIIGMALPTWMETRNGPANFLNNRFIDATGRWMLPAGARPDSRNNHAMVAVGYDNATRTFEIMNSWGADFGSGGFFRVSYSDFGKLTFYAGIIHLNEAPAEASSLAGSLTLQKNKRTESGVVADGAVTVRLNTQRFYEVSSSMPISKGDLFQLVVNKVPAGNYVYIFSIDQALKANVHFPKKGEGSIIPSNNAEVYFPSNTRSLKLDEDRDNLIVVYSKKKITDFSQRVARCRPSGSLASVVYTSVKQAFSDLLMPDSNIRYNQNRMQFAAGSVTGSAVMVMLHVETQ